MTFNDYKWLPMTTDDYGWLLMTTDDYRWLPMTIRWLSDDYLMTIRWLSDDYPMTIRWLYLYSYFFFISWCICSSLMIFFYSDTNVMSWAFVNALKWSSKWIGCIINWWEIEIFILKLMSWVELLLMLFRGDKIYLLAPKVLLDYLRPYLIFVTDTTDMSG